MRSKRIDWDQAKHRILSQVSLESVIGEVTELKIKGGRPVALCPFHEEKTPSLNIYDDHYFCFGCRASGDVIDFVREREGFGFTEALEVLAERYSIPLPELELKSGSQQAHLQLTDQLMQVSGMARDFFEQALQSDQGSQARRYLEGRGYDLQRLASELDFRFGYAPDSFDGLQNQLRHFDIDPKVAEQASLLGKSQKTGRYYDFFRDRLMIPIHNHRGKIIAFGGRRLSQDPEVAKYKNSRETPIFAKSQVLFGLHKARSHVRKKGRVLVVEGYMDAIKLWQEGLKETVGCLGTALTAEHLSALEKLTGEAYLMFDGDEAGQSAALKTSRLALQCPKLALKVCVLPRGHDPDSLVSEQGIQAIDDLCDKAVDIFVFSVRARLAQATPDAVPLLVQEEFLPWLKDVTDPLQREHWLQRLASLTGLSADLLKQQLGDAAHKESSPGVGRPSSANPPAGRAHQPLAHQPAGYSPASPAPLEENEQQQDQSAWELPRDEHSLVVYELIGHMFFAVLRSERVDRDLLKQLTEDLNPDPVWYTAARWLLEQIGSDGRAASQRFSDSADLRDHLLEQDIWHGDQLEGPWVRQRVGDLLEHIEWKTEAFSCEDRMTQIRKLHNQVQKEALKKKIALLKREIVKFSTQQQDLQASRELLSALIATKQELLLL